MKKIIIYAAILMLAMLADRNLHAQTGTISGTVFLDANANGMIDATESGMMDIQITLSDVNGDQATTTTDADGFYSFTDLHEGMYSVYITQWAQGIEPSTTAAQDVDITPENLEFTVDFGFMVSGGNTCSLTIANNTVFDAACDLDNASITTSVDGGQEPYNITVNGETQSETSNELSLSNLAAGAYVIEFTDAQNCSVSITNNIVQMGAPQYVIVTEDATCGSSNGSATIDISDETGSGNFTIVSEVGEVNGLQITGLGEGSYQATLVDEQCGEFPLFIGIECEQPTGGGNGDNNPPCSDTFFYCTPPLESVVHCFPADCDPDGDGVSILEHTGSLFGCSIHIDSDLCFTYTPLPAFLGEDFLEVTICDDNDDQLCSTSQFYFTVGTDCGPMAVDDEYELMGGGPSDLMVLENDEHPLDLEFSITEATDGFHGTVTIDPTGTFLIYTPEDGFAGGDSFNYTICDEDDNCVNALVVVTVEGEVVTNDCEADAGTLTPPVQDCIGLDGSIEAPMLSGANNESGFVYVYVLTTDANPNDNILYDIVSLNTTGAFDFSTIDGTAGTYSIHGLNYEGTLLDLVDFNPATGEEVLNAIAAQSICADLIVPGYQIEVSEDCDGTEVCEEVQYYCGEPQVPQDFCFDFCDLDGQVVIDSLASTYSNCSVTLINDTCVTYVAVPGYFGLDSVVAYSCSPLGCDTSWAYINVGCQFPVAGDDEAEATPGLPIFVNVLGNDSEPCNDDNSGLSVFVLDDPEHGFAAQANNGFDYVVDEDFEGVDEFTYVVCNDCTESLCDTATVTILVGIDELPPDTTEFSVQPDIVSTPISTPLEIDVLSNDSEGLTITEVGDAQNGLVILNNGMITYTPNGGFVGDDFFDYTACDEDGNCETTFVQVTVFDESENQPPTANNDVVEVASGSTTDIAVLVNDSDQEGNAFSITDVSDDSDCGDAEINEDGTALVFVAQEDCVGNFTITYTICEDENEENCDTAEVLIAVGEMLNNTAPIAENDTIFIVDFEGQLFNVAENDTDPQDDDLTYTVVSGPECAEGFEMNTDGQAIYDATDVEECPEDLVMYVVCDDAPVILCDTAFVYFVLDSTVIENPPAPGSIVAEDDEATVAFNGEVDVTIYDNDSSPENFLITIMSGPDNGTAEVNNNGTNEVSINYVPNMNFSGTDIIEYELCVDGDCDTAFLTITVDVACSFVIPNGISPNNDGIMDEFTIEGIEECYPEGRSLIIFNRWGNEIYRNPNFGSGDAWDGTWENEPVPDGTYFYIFTAEGSDELESIDVAGYLEVYR